MDNSKIQEINKDFKVTNFTFAKFIMTFAGIMAMTLPIIDILVYFNKISIASSILTTINIIILVIIFVAYEIYFWLRLYLHKLTKFKYNKKEFIFIILWTLGISLTTAFSLILNIILINNVANRDIIFYVFYPLIFILQIAASIFESLSRINEMSSLNYAKALDQKQQEQKSIQSKPKSSTKINESKITSVEKDKKDVKNPFMDLEEIKDED